MKKLVRFEFGENPVYAEVEIPDEEEGIRRVARGKDGVMKAESKFTDAIQSIKPAVESVLNTLKDMNTPDEVGFEFGIKLNASAGAIFAAAASEATFKVSLKWNNKKESVKKSST